MTGTCVISLTDADFDREVLQDPLPVLVDFYSDTCQPCKAAAPVLEQLCTERAGELKVVKANIEHCRQAARRHNLGAVPTFVLYRNGKILGATSGFQARTVFTNWIMGLLSKP